MEPLPSRLSAAAAGATAPAAARHRLSSLLAPRSIAFIGASARPNTPGHDMMRMIRRGGYGGSVHAINPAYREVEGYPCLPGLDALPEPPDLAVLAVRNERLEASLEAAISAGSRAAVVFASALMEEAADPPLAARLAAMAREAGLPVCGANCMGFYNDLDAVWICGFPSPRQPRRGSIALIAHSGSVFGALVHNDPRLATALAVSPGQEMTTTIADYIDYAVERPEVRVVGLFMETARDPDGFRAALRKAAARGIPVVALKVGRSEAAAAAALTHTGALAGNDLAYDALFDETGVIRVDTLDELAATLLLFAGGRRAAPGALVTIHDSGGERELTLDLADKAGVPFATIGEGTRRTIARNLDPGLEAVNPLDAWGTGADFSEKFEACFEALITDDDAALGLFCADIRDHYYLSDGFAKAATAVAARTGKLVALATNYTQLRHEVVAQRLTDAGVPVLDGTLNALVAVRGALAHRDFLSRPADDPPPAPAEPIPGRSRTRLNDAGGPLDEPASLALLAEWGIPVAPHAVVASEAKALAAATRLGFPVVAKTAAGALHKSDAGGVRLGLETAPALAAAFADLSERFGPRVLIARMMPRGVELALGAARDPQFGPLVTVSAGGVLVELLRDRVGCLAPFGPATARRLIERLALRRLLDGYRGLPAVDLDALSRIIARFSVFVATLAPDLAEIDVNPLLAGTEIAALDALIVPASRE